jgi:23S rRNA pseudoU1915 N3-methylase RlmH
MEYIEWKSPNIVTGPVAIDNYYYPRREIVDRIWNELDKGCSILLAAPRRVGKTSIMQYITANPKKNYKIAFEDFEGIDSKQRFYATLYRLLLECLSLNKAGEIKKWFRKYRKTKSISEIDIKGKIKIESLSLDFLDEIDHLIEEINRNVVEKVVVLIDELSTMLFNMYKNGKKEDAQSILQNMRRWRQISKNRNVQFVIAGSIGIHYVVNVVDQRNSIVYDLVSIPCEPLSKDEVSAYIDWATQEATVHYNNDLKKYIAEKIQYYVPYFINLMLNGIDVNAKKSQNPIVGEQQIDNAFDAILKNNGNLSDWRQRLDKYMLPNDFKFVDDLLTYTAHKDGITIQEIYDKAVKHEKTKDYMSFINNLEHDGYIVFAEEKYVFISPFLKEFWKKINPVYNK